MRKIFRVICIFWTICGAIVSLLIIALGIILIHDSRVIRTFESSDIKTYRNFGVSIPTSLAAFPYDLENVKDINNYYYMVYWKGFSHRYYEILLDITYSMEDFDLEIERLENFKSDRGMKLKFDNNILFNFPTYVAGYEQRKGGTYEYISVDESNYRIIYIFIQRGISESLKMPLEYQPKNYLINQDKLTRDGYAHSIYSFGSAYFEWYE